MIDLAKKMRIKARKNYKRAIRKTYRDAKRELLKEMKSATDNEVFIYLPRRYRLATRVLAQHFKKQGFNYRIDFSVCYDRLIIYWGKRP